MDATRFRELALAELDAVHRMAMALAKHPDTAADLVQETFLKAFKAEGRFELQDPDRGVRPYLFKILHNNFYTRHHKAKREMPLGDNLPEQAVDSLQDQPEPVWDLASLDWEQVDDRLKHAIANLPEHQRTPLLLWAVEGLKYREIADVLGVALGTVMSRLHRARGQLTQELAELAAEHGMTRGAARLSPDAAVT